MNLLRRAVISLKNRFIVPAPVPEIIAATSAGSTPASDAYAERRRREIEKFKAVENVHELPEIFHFWSNRYVRPKLEAVLGVSGIDDFFLKYIHRSYKARPNDTIVIVSIGAGNSDTELRLAQKMRNQGLKNFRFRCLDINPSMLERGRQLAITNDLANEFEFVESDVTAWQERGNVSIVMANHSLHHIVELELLFERVRTAIGREGYFLVCDMVGRNGHMRWPEALEIIHSIWKTMPDRYKFNHQLNRFEELYENWDCSTEGFEGIRAQDILPLLVKTFHFESFAAYGNLPDIFIDRGFGHNFDINNHEDTEFVDRIGTLNDRLISEGKVKPTQIVAALRADRTETTQCYEHWTPAFCVRTVG